MGSEGRRRTNLGPAIAACAGDWTPACHGIFPVAGIADREELHSH